MDRTRNPAASRGRIVLVAALAASIAGCSQFRGLRGLGTPKVGYLADPNIDPYLAHHRVAPPGPGSPPTAVAAEGASDDPGRGATLVRSTIHPTSTTAEAGPTPTESVTLGSPVALPTVNHPRPGAAVETPDPLAEARAVVAAARAKLDAMSTYRVRISRQERVGDALLPAEDVTLSVRRAPRAVRLEWPTGPHKGREVIYSASDPSGLLHVHMGDSPIPVPKLSLRPDSPMVMKNSRHPITEAGFDTIVAALERDVSGTADGSTTAYAGIETPEAVGRPCHKIERRNAAGETWLFYLDAKTDLPAMVHGASAKGDLLERYVFADVRPDLDELASADAFDPSRRWGGPGNFLGRIARTNAGDANPSATTGPR